MKCEGLLTMRQFDLKQLSPRELLSLFGQVLEQLRKREVVRSGNNPVADYCESLVVRALRLTREPGSNKGFDARDSGGKYYEIKGRRITKHNPSTQLSVCRELDAHQFDYLVGVLFDSEFDVTRACCVPWEVVKQCATHREYVHGWIMHLTPSVWEQDGVRDITAELRKAQNDWTYVES